MADVRDLVKALMELVTEWLASTQPDVGGGDPEPEPPVLGAPPAGDTAALMPTYFLAPNGQWLVREIIFKDTWDLVWGATTDSSHSMISPESHSGTYALHVTIPEGRSFHVARQSALMKRMVISLEIWIRAVSATPAEVRAGACDVELWMTGEGGLVGRSPVMNVTTEWKRFIFTREQLKMDFFSSFDGFLLRNAGNSRGGSFYIDDICLTRRYSIFPIPPPPIAPTPLPPPPPPPEEVLEPQYVGPDGKNRKREIVFVENFGPRWHNAPIANERTDDSSLLLNVGEGNKLVAVRRTKASINEFIELELWAKALAASADLVLLLLEGTVVVGTSPVFNPNAEYQKYVFTRAQLGLPTTAVEFGYWDRIALKSSGAASEFAIDDIMVIKRGSTLSVLPGLVDNSTPPDEA